MPGGDGAEDKVLGKGKILAVWTDDTALSTRINREVAHYTGQAELADAIQEGLEARKAGDVETATAKLGRAVQLATETGHSDTAKLLAKVVDVEDARTGTVRLKRKVATVDEMTLDTRSSQDDAGTQEAVADARRPEPHGHLPAGPRRRRTTSSATSAAGRSAALPRPRPLPRPLPPAAEPELPPAGATCQACGAALAGRFCEACGHDSLAALPTAPPLSCR